MKRLSRPKADHQAKISNWGLSGVAEGEEGSNLWL
jgi:hypothetical protein